RPGGRLPGGARGTARGKRRPQPEPEERVVAGLAEAVRTQLGVALEIVRRADRPCSAAPETRKGGARAALDRPATARRSRHRQSIGVQPVAGDRSRNASGSKISASISMPSTTRGPGREKYDEPSRAIR